MIVQETTAKTETVPRLTFFKLVVSDLEAMKAFYIRAFSLREANTIEGEAFEEVMLRSKGGFTLVLYRWKDGRQLVLGNAYGPVGFMIPDLQSTFDRAISLGAKPSRPPAPINGMNIAFVYDPEGHEIEMIEEAQAKA